MGERVGADEEQANAAEPVAGGAYEVEEGKAAPALTDGVLQALDLVDGDEGAVVDARELEVDGVEPVEGAAPRVGDRRFGHYEVRNAGEGLGQRLHDPTVRRLSVLTAREALEVTRDDSRGRAEVGRQHGEQRGLSHAPLADQKDDAALAVIEVVLNNIDKV